MERIVVDEQTAALFREVTGRVGIKSYRNSRLGLFYPAKPAEKPAPPLNAPEGKSPVEPTPENDVQ